MKSKGYEISIPVDEEMQQKAKQLVETFYEDADNYESLDQFVAYINYIRGYCGELIDIVAEELLKRQG